MFNVKNIFRRVGPGVITGAADDDPSGIATYSQTGAKFGYSLLWLSLFTLPLMYAVQEMSARLAMVTGRGLADLLRQHYSKRTVLVLALLFFIVNTINIGANLGAMAASMTLLFPGPSIAYLLGIAALVICLELFTSYKTYTRVLRWMILALASYVLTAFFTDHDWVSVAKNFFVPVLTGHPDLIMMIVAILGTTIAPYLFFWQASEEVEEEIKEGRTDVPQRLGATAGELSDMRRDVAMGMILSNVIMFFIIVTTAGTLYRSGITEIETAAHAAEALRPLAGDFTFLLFTIGIIGTGLIGVPVLAGSASFALAEVFNWREGIEQSFRQAKPFHLTMVAATVLGAATTLLGISPINFLIMAAVLNGLLAPVLLWYIVRLADRTSVVGEHRSPPGVRTLGWLTFGVMTLAGALYLFDLIR